MKKEFLIIYIILNKTFQEEALIDVPCDSYQLEFLWWW